MDDMGMYILYKYVYIYRCIDNQHVQQGSSDHTTGSVTWSQSHVESRCGEQAHGLSLRYLYYIYIYISIHVLYIYLMAWYMYTYDMYICRYIYINIYIYTHISLSDIIAVLCNIDVNPGAAIW
jgi:hypothetical protein